MRCPKCGEETLGVWFRQIRLTAFQLTGILEPPVCDEKCPDGQHLHYRCFCGFSEVGMCKDAPGITGPLADPPCALCGHGISDHGADGRQCRMPGCQCQYRPSKGKEEPVIINPKAPDSIHALIEYIDALKKRADLATIRADQLNEALTREAFHADKDGRLIAILLDAMDHASYHTSWPWKFDFQDGSVWQHPGEGAYPTFRAKKNGETRSGFKTMREAFEWFV